MHDMRGWHILNGTLKTYWSIYDKVNNLLWCCVSYEKCQDSTCQHSTLTLGLWFCTFLWCVRWISHFGNRRTCFHWKCNVLRCHHWYIFKWDHEFKLNLPNLSLDLHPMSMEITEAGRRLRFSLYSWNQKTDRIIVLSFLVSRLLLKLELPHYDLGLIHLNTQYSLCKLGTTEKYQKWFSLRNLSHGARCLSPMYLSWSEFCCCQIRCAHSQDSFPPHSTPLRSPAPENGEGSDFFVLQGKLTLSGGADLLSTSSL